MARRTAALKPQLNQIRTWARDGRTDAWIAFQLGTTAATVQEFRSEHGLDRGGGDTAEEPVTPEIVVQTISFDTPPPVVAAPAAPSDSRPSEPAPAPHAPPAPQPDTAGDEADADGRGRERRERRRDRGRRLPTGEPERAKRRRRRGGRGGGGTAGQRRSAAPASETPRPSRPRRRRQPARPRSGVRARRRATTGSVVAGAVIVLDPAVARSAAWRAHWADGPAFDVVIDDEQIVLRRRT